MQKNTVPKSVLKFLFFVMIGLAFFVMWGKQFQFDSKTKKDADEKAAQSTGPVYSLKPFFVELSGRYLNVIKGEDGQRPFIDTRKKYLRVAINLELKNKTAAKELEKRLAQIRDAISETISAKKAGEIESVEGKAILGEEIVGKLNSILGEESITKAFFAEFIIQ